MLLSINNLKKHFPVRGGLFATAKAWVHAVDGVSFSIKHGETVGIVGESGCGKSTLGRLVIHLLAPTSGQVVFDDRDVFALKGRELKALRKDMQIIFQDPFASLNPRQTISEIIREPLDVHKLGSPKEREEYVSFLLDKVGLRQNVKERYPHEFSGGQRQRISIARALALRPKLVVCDEPVSALDVSIQAQILNLMIDLQEEFDLTYMFIAHDLSVVEHISNNVVVMYLGKVVEKAPRDELFFNPVHPYTQALLSAIPVPDPTRKSKRIVLQGDVPSPINPPKGCNFHPRCPYQTEICRQEEPNLENVAIGDQDEHLVSCHHKGRFL